VNSLYWNAGPGASEILLYAGRRWGQVRCGRANRTVDCQLTAAGTRGFQEVEDNLTALRVLEMEAGTEQAAVPATVRLIVMRLMRSQTLWYTWCELCPRHQNLLFPRQRPEQHGSLFRLSGFTLHTDSYEVHGSSALAGSTDASGFDPQSR
jgi:hypothetical protein